MRAVTYFPTYSQAENRTTNTVLLLLAHINRIAPDLFKAFLDDLSDSQFILGPIFANQDVHKDSGSVVDAVIRQDAIEINIETKITKDDSLDLEQLARHAKAMKSKSGTDDRILLGLTPDRMPSEREAEAQELCLSHGVTFVHRTFLQVIRFFEDMTADFRTDMNPILEDFRLYLSEKGLMPRSHNRMVINPCGTSLETNRTFGIYHDQPWRSKVPCKYLGCYHDKAVRLVGEVRAILIAEVVSGALKIHERLELPWQTSPSPVTEADKARVLALIEASPYADLRTQKVRFYLTDGFEETVFRKTSSGGIRGHQYFNLDGEDGVMPDMFRGEACPDIAQIASALSEETWT